MFRKNNIQKWLLAVSLNLLFFSSVVLKDLHYVFDHHEETEHCSAKAEGVKHFHEGSHDELCLVCILAKVKLDNFIHKLSGTSYAELAINIDRDSVFHDPVLSRSSINLRGPPAILFI